MDKIRILTVTTSGLARKEGISTVILDYYSRFDKNKFELDIIASGNYGYELVTAFQNIGVNIQCLPSRKNSFPEYVKAFIKLIKKRKYDALYIHGSSAIMATELVLARISGCTIRVVHSHNTTCEHKRADKILRPIFYRSYTQALACGEDAGKWLYGGRKFEVIKNGRDVDTYKYDPESRKKIRKTLGLEEDVLAIGHVGNFTEQKNQKFLVEIMDVLRSQNVKARLYLIGDGRTREGVEKLVKDKNLEDVICFTGSIQNVPEMLQAMDVMALPSLYEGLPLVAIEWQIAALPCLLSDCITRECAYTKQVRFLSLDAGAQKWADEIIKFKDYNRQSVAKECIALTKENGYALEQNAEKLQSFFDR